MMSLDQYFSWPFRPPGPTCDLDNLLGETFGGPKVEAKQTLVSINNANQADAGKIMTLGQHLGTDEQADFASVNGFKHALQFPFTLRRVAIDSCQANAGKRGFQIFLDALGTFTHGFKRCL